MSASDTPRTDAYEFALRQFGIEPQEAETDNNGPILSMNRHARTLERESAAKDATIYKLTGDLAACDRGQENLNRMLAERDATIARLMALVQDAYDDPDSEILGADWNNAARTALSQELPQ